MLKAVAKFCAKFALGYLDKVAVWALGIGAAKVSSDAKAMRVLMIVKQISADANAIAKAIEDGKIDDAEALAIQVRVKALAEELKALL